MVGKYVSAGRLQVRQRSAQARWPEDPSLRQHRVHRLPDIETRGAELLEGLDAILVPGGFGERGVEGKILAANMPARTRSRTSVSAWACRLP
jgi:hypothetical protein